MIKLTIELTDEQVVDLILSETKYQEKTVPLQLQAAWVILKRIDTKKQLNYQIRRIIERKCVGLIGGIFQEADELAYKDLINLVNKANKTR